MEVANFRRAADVLNMSQPALSRRIQKLEGTVGGSCFSARPDR
ncbi:LysR family transcriptional regulator [Devosia sp. ZW T5_3]